MIAFGTGIGVVPFVGAQSRDYAGEIGVDLFEDYGK